MTGDSMAVGFGDMVRFGFGAAVPSLILSSALIIAACVGLGGDVGSGITAAFTCALVLAIGLEMFRRYVLIQRGSGGFGAVRVFRFFVWAVVVSALPITMVLGLGVLMPCYGRACDPTARFMLEFMFGCCVCTLAMVPLGYALLRRASWLRVDAQD